MSSHMGRYKDTRFWIFFGYAFLLVFVGGVFAWAATSSISGAVIAPGIVGVEGRIKTVQHLDGGIVREILVANGDFVAAGDVMISLDDTDIRANLAIITDSFFNTHTTIARLKAERDQATIVSYPQILLDNQQDPRIAQTIASQDLQFTVRAQNMDGQAQVMEQKILQLKEQITGLNAQQAAIETQREIVNEEIIIKSPAVESGIISGDTMRILEQNKARLSGEFERIGSNIAQTLSAIEETKLQILQLSMEFQNQVLSDLDIAENKLAEFQEKRTAVEDRLRRIDIRAPSTGRVHDLVIHTIGGVISPASPILQIIPEGEQLIFEAKISPTDIDSVKIGQEGAVHLSAFASRTTPVLIGYVKNRSAAPLVDQVTGANYFLVDIEISQEELNRLNEEQVLVTGMPAEIFIKTEQRNTLSYFLQPFLDVAERAFRDE